MSPRLSGLGLASSSHVLVSDIWDSLFFFYTYSIKKFCKHSTNYNNYKLRYNTTKTMPQGAKYYVYPAAVLEVIKKIYTKLHITIKEKEL